MNENPFPEKTPVVNPGSYSPVTVIVKDTLGTIFLGIIAGISLIAWIRAETRYRALLTQQEMIDGNHSLDAR